MKTYMPFKKVRLYIKAFFPNKPHRMQEIFEDYTSSIQKNNKL
jgi:hypothetical protein